MRFPRAVFFLPLPRAPLPLAPLLLAPLLLAPLLLSGCADSSHKAQASMPPQPYCTRTLGLAQCFADPAALPDHPAPLADTPVRTPQPPPPLWRRIANDWNRED